MVFLMPRIKIKSEMRWEIANPVEEENEKNRVDKRALCTDAQIRVT